MHRERQQQMKAKPLTKELKVQLEDVYSGKLIKLSYQRTRICDECSGKGGKNTKKCSDCKGTGISERIIQMGPGSMFLQRSQCDECRGQGIVYAKKDECKGCQGNKIIQESRTIDVSIEPGIPNGHPIKLCGDGNEMVINA